MRIVCFFTLSLYLASTSWATSQVEESPIAHYVKTLPEGHEVLLKASRDFNSILEGYITSGQKLTYEQTVAATQYMTSFGASIALRKATGRHDLSPEEDTKLNELAEVSSLIIRFYNETLCLLFKSTIRL